MVSLLRKKAWTVNAKDVTWLTVELADDSEELLVSNVKSTNSNKTPSMRFQGMNRL
jgi:hypothetical protein